MGFIHNDQPGGRAGADGSEQQEQRADPAFHVSLDRKHHEMLPGVRAIFVLTWFRLSRAGIVCLKVYQIREDFGTPGNRTSNIQRPTSNAEHRTRRGEDTSPRLIHGPMAFVLEYVCVKRPVQSAIRCANFSERGSLSRSSTAGTTGIGSPDTLLAGEPAAGHRPALLSVPAAPGYEFLPAMRRKLASAASAAWLSASFLLLPLPRPSSTP